jgi:site-specific DNA-cytosine methylase
MGVRGMDPEKLIFATVCSGIESASVAWEPLGMVPMWFSEIEAFPSAVLSHRWPHVYNWGDFTKIPAHLMRGHADILVGGTPCQAFSVAGKQMSLDDDRGNLTLEFCKLADSLKPRVIVWENVPGVLSTSDNAFGCFLAKLCGNDMPAIPTNHPTEQEINPDAKVPKVTGPKSKYWRWDNKQSEFVPKWPTYGAAIGPSRRVAWRVLDAQYFGVAQRRRRVFVVASARDDIDPTKILFEYDGVCRDTPPSREAGKGSASFTPSGFGAYREGCGTLRAKGGGQARGLHAMPTH